MTGDKHTDPNPDSAGKPTGQPIGEPLGEPLGEPQHGFAQDAGVSAEMNDGVDLDLTVEPRDVFLTHPANFLALGAGSGLAPFAPGTFGTLAAVPLVWFFPASLPAFTLLVLVLFIVGVRFCDHCSQDLGVHDHGAIVFDEWVGYFIAMMAVPRSFTTLLLAFILFRLFDILKPWPIRNLDARVHGGFGIMIDDVVAGLMALTVMHALLNLGWVPWV